MARRKRDVTDERLQEVVNVYALHGKEATLSTFGIVEETLNRYLRLYRSRYGKNNYDAIILAQKLRDKYSEAEIKVLLNDKSSGLQEFGVERVKLSGGGNRLKFAVLSDLHLGSIFTSEDFLLKAIDYVNNLELDFVLITGDVTEGFSNREGHVYELSKIGYHAQKEYAIEMLSKVKHQMYMISGNHDLWYYKKNGAKIVHDICNGIENAVFLGEDYATLKVPNGPDIGLWHGGSDGGGSYARSYRMQKIIESINVEDRPQILLTGHDHKYVSIYTGGVYGIGCGAIQSQSNWMKGKRLEANTGFIVADVEFEGKNILALNHTFIIPRFIK